MLAALENTPRPPAMVKARRGCVMGRVEPDPFRQQRTPSADTADIAAAVGNADYGRDFRQTRDRRRHQVDGCMSGQVMDDQRQVGAVGQPLEVMDQTLLTWLGIIGKCDEGGIRAEVSGPAASPRSSSPCRWCRWRRQPGTWPPANSTQISMVRARSGSVSTGPSPIKEQASNPSTLFRAIAIQHVPSSRRYRSRRRETA